MTNPLLDFSGLPRFADIRTEHIAPAVEQLLAENRALLRRDRRRVALDGGDEPDLRGRPEARAGLADR